MMIPAGWICPCCMTIWGPFVGTCPVCSMTGQMNDELRAFHECPQWAPVVDEYFLGLATAPSPPGRYRVDPRPHIGQPPPPAPDLRVTVITPCLACEMPLDHCKRVSGGKGCCSSCDHFGVGAKKQ